jgi:hypothetical protein
VLNGIGVADGLGIVFGFAVGVRLCPVATVENVKANAISEIRNFIFTANSLLWLGALENRKGD